MSKVQFYTGIILTSLLSGIIVYFITRHENFNVSEHKNQTEGPAGNTMQLSSILSDTNIVVPEGLNFIYAANKVTPMVVHIKSLAAKSESYVHPFEELFPDFFENHPNDLPVRSSGSGVIVSSDGYIITNYHVVENAKNIEVTLNDNRRYSATVIGEDPTTDIALIRVEELDLPYIELGNSDMVKIGEWVLAVGNPFELTSTVTAGIVSAKARNINIMRGREYGIESFIQTDAAVNPGNSGGALVNLRGELVGINTAIATPTGTYAGYSFAVPSLLVKKVMEDLLKFGTVQRALLGIRIQDMNADLAEELEINERSGVYVAAVNPESSAEDAGLKEGDIIIAIDGSPVRNVAELQEQVARNRPGDKIDVTFKRDGKEKTTTAILKNYSNEVTVVKKENVAEWNGAVFVELNEKLKKELKIEGGIQVKTIRSGKWKEAGILEGFIITHIDKAPVSRLDEFSRILNEDKDRYFIEGLYPDGKEDFYRVGK